MFLYAFDLIELNGDDIRRDPLGVRKATLASILVKAGTGIRLNEHLDEADVPARVHARARWHREQAEDSTYRSGRSRDWIKSKNPACEAVRREAEVDWGVTMLAKADAVWYRTNRLRTWPRH